nr:MAG TPA: hypothetical protein [Caudoviricetes sp.]
MSFQLQCTLFSSQKGTRNKTSSFYEGESVSHSSLWLLTSHV